MFAQSTVNIYRSPIATVVLIGTAVGTRHHPLSSGKNQCWSSAVSVLCDCFPFLRRRATHIVGELPVIGTFNLVESFSEKSIGSSLTARSRIRKVVGLAVDTPSQDPDGLGYLVGPGIDRSWVVIGEGTVFKLENRHVVAVGTVAVAIEDPVRVAIGLDGREPVVPVVNGNNAPVGTAHTVRGGHDKVGSDHGTGAVPLFEEGNEKLGVGRRQNGSRGILFGDNGSNVRHLEG